MKKYSLLFSALCACVVFSCNKEVNAPKEEVNEEPKEVIENPGDGMRTITISASVDEDITKTSYTGGTTFKWTAGDKISIYCSDGVFRDFTATTSAAASTFTGSVPDGVSLGSLAYFPAAKDNHTTTSIYIPETKDLTGNGSADLPMIGSKGEGDVYAFQHCSGAVKFTVANIPAGIVKVKVSFVSTHATEPDSKSLRLSGLCYVSSTPTPGKSYSAAYATSLSERTYTRTVSVSDNEAVVYVPYATGGTMHVPNVINIVGYDSSDNEVNLLADKTMKAISAYTFERAHVKPLSTLVLNNLSRVNWSASGVASASLDVWQTTTVGLTELKAVADDYYLYARVKGPASSITSSNYMDVYLSDGEDGSYVYHDYWLTTGSTYYKQEHKGSVTTTSLTLTFNDKSVDTKTETSGEDVIWYMALPRSAHSLLTSAGTVYFGVTLWQAWSIIGCIPSQRTWDHESYLVGVTLP